MKASISLLLATLFAVANHSATAIEETAQDLDPINLEVVSSYFPNVDLDDYPTHHNIDIDTISPQHDQEHVDITEEIQTSSKNNLRGLQQSPSCTSSEKLVQLTLLTNNSPQDTTWTLKSNNNNGNTLIDSSRNKDYQASTGYQTKYCLTIGKKYTLTVKDANGNGMSKGFYKLAVSTNSGWKILSSGGKGSFTTKSSDIFSITNSGGNIVSNNNAIPTPKPQYAPVPTPSNYAHQSSNASKPSASAPSYQGTGAMVEQFGKLIKTPLESQMGCGSNARRARVIIQLDAYGAETSWTLKNENGKVFMRNGRTYGKNDYEVVERCLPEGEYRLVIVDGAGDGICCQSGQGYYTFSLETSGTYEEIYRGGKFKSKTDSQKIKIAPTYMNDRDHEWLDAHNTRRRKYHRQYKTSYVPLKWSEGLKQSAASYAEELLSSCPSPTIIHDPHTAYGENMAKNRGVQGWGDLKPADNILTRFVERELDDPWPHNAHLTQALWRATRYVGCAESVMPLGKGMCRIQVCRYARSGNCNVKKSVDKDWYDKMLADESACDPICPPEGCF